MQDLQPPQRGRTPERATVPSSQAGTHPTKKKIKKPPPTQPCSRVRNSQCSVERGGRVRRGDKRVGAAGSRRRWG